MSRAKDAYLISWKKNGASPRRRDGIRSSGDLASSKNVGEVLVTIDASWSDLTRGNETKQESARGEGRERYLRAYGYIKTYLLGDALASRRRPTTAPPCGHAGLDGGH